MKQVEIYTSPICGFCVRAKRLLDAKGVAYVEHDVFSEPGARAEMAERNPGARTVPQIAHAKSRRKDILPLKQLLEGWIVFGDVTRAPRPTFNVSLLTRLEYIMFHYFVSSFIFPRPRGSWGKNKGRTGLYSGDGNERAQLLRSPYRDQVLPYVFQSTLDILHCSVFRS